MLRPIHLFFLLLFIFPILPTQSSFNNLPSVNHFVKSKIAFSDVPLICDQIILDSYILDSLLNGEISQTEIQSQGVACPYKLVSRGSWIELIFTKMIKFCAVFIRQQKSAVSSTQYPDCEHMFNPTLGDNPIDLVRLRVYPSSDSLHDEQWYLKRMKATGSSFSFVLIDFEAFGSFFRRSSRALGYSSDEVKSLRVRFKHSIPRTDSETFTGLTSLSSFALRYDCELSETTLREIYRKSEKGPARLTLRLFSPHLREVRISMPCAVVELLDLGPSSPKHLISLELANLGDYVSTRWKNLSASSKATRAVGVEDLFGSALGFFTLTFSSYSDRMHLQTLPADFFNSHNYSSFYIHYNEKLPSHLKRVLPPWKAGCPLRTGIFSMDYFSVNQEVIDNCLNRIRSKKDGADFVLLILQNIVWNTVGTFSLSTSAILYVFMLSNRTASTHQIHLEDSVAANGTPRTTSEIDLTGLYSTAFFVRLTLSCETSQGVSLNGVNGTVSDRTHVRFGNLSNFDEFFVEGCGFRVENPWSLDMGKVVNFGMRECPTPSPFSLEQIFPCVHNGSYPSVEKCCSSEQASYLTSITLEGVPHFMPTRLSEGMLCTLPRVQKMFFRDNAIKEISDNILAYLPEIAHFDISNNNIAMLPPLLFDGKEMLYTVDISGNELETLPERLCNNSTMRSFVAAGNALDSFNMSAVLGDCRVGIVLDLEPDLSLTLSVNVNLSYNDLKSVILPTLDEFAVHTKSFGDHSYEFLVRYNFDLSHNSVTSFKMRSDDVLTNFPRTSVGIDLSFNGINSLRGIAVTKIKGLALMNLSHNAITDEALSGEYSSISESCGQFGCIVDLSYNFINARTGAFDNLFPSTPLLALDLSFNGMVEFPSSVVDLPFIVPETPYESEKTLKLLRNREFFYAVVRLRGNPIRSIEESICWRIEQSKFVVYYDLSDCALEYMGPEAFQCDSANSILMVNLNRNPLDCFPFPKRISSVELLSLENTNVTSFHCSLGSRYAVLKSLYLKSEKFDVDCCALTSTNLKHVEYAINPENTDGLSTDNLYILSSVATDSPAFDQHTTCRFEALGGSSKLASLQLYEHLEKSGEVQTCSSSCTSSNSACLPKGFVYLNSAPVRFLTLLLSLALLLFSFGVCVVWSAVAIQLDRKQKRSRGSVCVTRNPSLMRMRSSLMGNVQPNRSSKTNSEYSDWTMVGLALIASTQDHSEHELINSSAQCLRSPDYGESYPHADDAYEDFPEPQTDTEPPYKIIYCGDSAIQASATRDIEGPPYQTASDDNGGNARAQVLSKGTNGAVTSPYDYEYKYEYQYQYV